MKAIYGFLLIMTCQFARAEQQHFSLEEGKINISGIDIKSIKEEGNYYQFVNRLTGEKAKKSSLVNILLKQQKPFIIHVESEPIYSFSYIKDRDASIQISASIDSINYLHSEVGKKQLTELLSKDSNFYCHEIKMENCLNLKDELDQGFSVIDTQISGTLSHLEIKPEAIKYSTALNISIVDQNNFTNALYPEVKNSELSLAIYFPEKTDFRPRSIPLQDKDRNKLISIIKNHLTEGKIRKVLYINKNDKILIYKSDFSLNIHFL